MVDPFIEQLEFLKLKAKCSEDDPVLLAYLMEQIKKLHDREQEKMSEETATMIQKYVDQMMKDVPNLIAQKKLELKNEMSRIREHSAHVRSGDNKGPEDNSKPEKSVFDREGRDDSSGSGEAPR